MKIIILLLLSILSFSCEPKNKYSGTYRYINTNYDIQKVIIQFYKVTKYNNAYIATGSGQWTDTAGASMAFVEMKTNLNGLITITESSNDPEFIAGIYRGTISDDCKTIRAIWSSPMEQLKAKLILNAEN